MTALVDQLMTDPEALPILVLVGLAIHAPVVLNTLAPAAPHTMVLVGLVIPVQVAPAIQAPVVRV